MDVLLLATEPLRFVLPLGLFGGTLLIGWVVRRLVMRALRSWIARTQSLPGRILTEALRGPMWIWILMLAVHAAVQASDLSEKITRWESLAIGSLWIFSLTLMFMRVAGNLVRYYGAEVPGALPVTTLTQNLAQLGVLILGLLLVLRQLKFDITPILTALGVGGLAVALALQDTLSNLFGGFYVAVAGQVRLGDYIRLNTGEEGYVTDIAWRSTTIRGLSNNMIIVPNAKLAQAIVTNFNLPSKRMASNLLVWVTYTTKDLDRVERVLLDLARHAAGEIPGMLADPPPSVQLEPGFGELGLGFTVNYQVAEFANQGGVRHELRKRVFHRFQEEGIEMPYLTGPVVLRGRDGVIPPKG